MKGHWYSVCNEELHWYSVCNEELHWYSVCNEELHWYSVCNEELHWSSVRNEELHWSSVRNEELHWSSVRNEELHWSSVHNDYAGDQIKRNEIGAACSTYGRDRKVAHRVFVGKPEERDNLKYLGIDGSVILKSVFNKQDKAWNGLIWLRIGTGGGLL